MCGISGFFNFSGLSLSGIDELILKMSDALKHRGADDEGIWYDQSCGIALGHRRLSIIDLSPRGHQPMISHKGTVIVYNGEIYNHIDLRKNLQDQQFTSESDTETLIYLYEKYQERCLHKINGMFTFAVWDDKKKQLFLARDRIGIKPLYYTTLGGVFSFASEIKALLQLPWVNAVLDEKALYDFLTFNKLSPPQTLFKDIHKMHPGYLMTVNQRGIHTYEKYWEPRYSDLDDADEDEVQEFILTEFEKSVSRRLLADVPLGAFLSGGVDSSAVVAMMRKHSQGSIRTFSIGFAGAPDYDELVYARKISKKFNTDHIERTVTPQDIIDFLPKIVEIFDEPLADATSIPIYFISQLARENDTKVVLTGDGSDELFLGYRNWMRYTRLYPHFRRFSKLPKKLQLAVTKIYDLVGKDNAKKEIFNRSLLNQEFFWGGAGGFKESAKREFLSPDFIHRLQGHTSYDRVREFRKMFDNIPRNGRIFSDADWMSYVGVMDIIPNYYLYRADRLGMANSIELRVPFLDHEFVNLALSIPGVMKQQYDVPKYILKKSFEKILDKETLYRKKQGFCVPLHEWANEIMVAYLMRHSKKFCNDTGIFKNDSLQALVENYRAAGNNSVFMLWNLYFLISWFKKWFRC